MKKNYLIFLLSFCFLAVSGQEVYYLEVEPNQQVDIPGGTSGAVASFEKLNGVVVLGGLHNKEGIGRFIEVNGNKLIIDSMTPMFDGTKEVVLRRKDGRLFSGLFTTLRGRLSPMTKERMQKDSTGVNSAGRGGGL